ncbi:ferrous iron transport protein A [Thermodesulfitimonas autotrophica]|uniref:Ferrous iron transport protein A n=1 Tax=Thermodesulfitimonas autotrophica TaxID=1894989 RepID=A0A3N5BA70_9THEO|nr:FeoA family protein [Thermodesulfitimonas autotrophica]RPF42565.1 ferrous iron transport protein A [Thermodesulfitimonas autotrophica]
MAPLPLRLLLAGEEGIVRAIGGGKELYARLAALGFVPGKKVRVVQNQMCGPLIVSLGAGRVALGRGVAQRILVEKVLG